MSDLSARTPGTFVLTTGRAGSTFVARILNRHPEIVVVSDLLEPALDEIYFDHDVLLDGASFWSVLARPSIPERIAHWRDRPTDELLYLPQADGDVSLLMAYTLPFLTDDPWEARRELGAAVTTRPTATARDHFGFVLDFLRTRFGGTTWVERTGGGLPHTSSIIDAWPDARYVELSRDPVETALSMRTGSFFRLYLAMSDGDAANWLADRHTDPAALAAMIERWTVDAAAATRTLSSEQLLHLTYERLVTEPYEAMADLLGFVLGRTPTAEDERWLADSATDVSAAPRRSGELAADEVDRIRAACPIAWQRWAAQRAIERATDE